MQQQHIGETLHKRELATMEAFIREAASGRQEMGRELIRNDTDV
jgi:hypothetical protein